MTLITRLLVETARRLKTRTNAFQSAESAEGPAAPTRWSWHKGFRWQMMTRKRNCCSVFREFQLSWDQHHLQQRFTSLMKRSFYNLFSVCHLRFIRNFLHDWCSRSISVTKNHRRTHLEKQHKHKTETRVINREVHKHSCRASFASQIQSNTFLMSQSMKYVKYLILKYILDI